MSQTPSGGYIVSSTAQLPAVQMRGRGVVVGTVEGGVVVTVEGVVVRTVEGVVVGIVEGVVVGTVEGVVLVVGATVEVIVVAMVVVVEDTVEGVAPVVAIGPARINVPPLRTLIPLDHDSYWH